MMKINKHLGVINEDAEAKGQLVRVSSSIPWAPGPDSGRQAGWQVPFPAEPPRWSPHLPGLYLRDPPNGNTFTTTTPQIK